MLLVTQPARAQDQPADTTKRALAASLLDQSATAYDQRDFAKAEDLLRRHLKIDPRSFVAYYNLACCRAAQGDPAGAGEHLAKAVEFGFTDIRYLRRDPTFDAVRDDPNYRRIVDTWPTLQLASLDANLATQRAFFAKGYHEWRDERLKIHCLSAFDARTDDHVKAEFTRLADWAAANVIPDLFDPEQAVDDAWVVVVLPTQSDFTKWATSVYGPGAVRGTSMIAGSYEHDAKRLVSMDLGATLRHEFFHVLHWRDITRKGQTHPVWIMEGLCSLVEDYDLTPDGHLTPVASWRTNSVKRVERIGKLTPFADLTAMSQQKFIGSRPLANYALARAAFLYLHDSNRLKDWYAHYTTRYRDDPSGLRALELATGLVHADLDADFKRWVRASLAMVPEEIKPGMASLGLEVDAGTGEGPVVTAVARSRDGVRPNLRVGDIITAIDHRPVRDLAELVRVLSAYKPGDTVEVAYRRYRLAGTASVTLVRK
ncbi:MAG: hypothetical protein HBSAPP03_17720 [Phycisphaerae bacterium]|nr:MAG: hypothetical protein HBSAPP03_17720 [Phycisphaerae bacterium]